VADHKATWRKRTREWAVALLGGACADCGTADDLDFDHTDPAAKEFAVSVGIRDGYGRARLLPEIMKCELRCRPCHLAKTLASGENTGGGWNKIPNPQHGTCILYNGGCRCNSCLIWRLAYRRRLVDAQGNLRPWC
jgi:hypothetical protein